MVQSTHNLRDFKSVGTVEIVNRTVRDPYDRLLEHVHQRSYNLNAFMEESRLVRVVASGICQTDVHARDGFFPIPCPAVYGHEGAGVVERVGRAVTTLKPGDHVIMANPSCGECPECLAGGRGARFSLEAARFPEALRAAVEVLAPCGTACLVGSARAGVEVPLEMRTMQQGRVVRGCVQGESDVQTFLPRLIALYRAGKLPIERLVRHYAHAAINDAVADMLAGTTIKAVLQLDTASFPPSPAGDR